MNYDAGSLLRDAFAGVERILLDDDHPMPIAARAMAHVDRIVSEIEEPDDEIGTYVAVALILGTILGEHVGPISTLTPDLIENARSTLASMATHQRRKQ